VRAMSKSTICPFRRSSSPSLKSAISSSWDKSAGSVTENCSDGQMIFSVVIGRMKLRTFDAFMAIEVLRVVVRLEVKEEMERDELAGEFQNPECRLLGR